MTNVIRLRLQFPKGSVILTPMDNTTLADFRVLASNASMVSLERLVLRTGFPPVPLMGSESDLIGKLMRSGEVVTVEDAGLSVTGTGAKVSVVSALSPSGGKKLVLKKMPDDNSCLFHSIHFLLEVPNSIEDGFCEELRQTVAGIIMSRSDDFSSVVLGMNVENYVERIMRKDQWGGAVELAIFSEHYQVEIVTFNIQENKPIIFNQGKFNERVFVFYSGIHYDVGLSESGQTKFSVTDQAAFESAV